VRGPATKVCDSPLALTSGGDILLNVAQSNGPADAESLFERALATGRPVFIGTILAPAELRFACRWIDDSSAALAAHLSGDRSARRKKRRR